MTQPNQSELAHVMGQCKCDTFMPCWYWHTVKRIEKTTDKTSLHDVMLMREQHDYITANYTPNAEVAERERAAFIAGMNRGFDTLIFDEKRAWKEYKAELTKPKEQA